MNTYYAMYKEYEERIIGRNAFTALLYHETVMFLAKRTPGGIGVLLRRLLYNRLFKQCGSGIILAENITFRGVTKIEIGNNVWIDSNALIDASPESQGLFLENDVEIHQGALIATGRTENSTVHIGQATRVGPYTCIFGHGGIHIGQSVLIAGHNFIVASQHRYHNPKIFVKDQGITATGIVIGDDVWIGANCVIMDGVTVGQGCVIGAGAIVNKDISPYSVAAGQPARIIKQRGV